ncbi:MAG: hypothetical protein IKA64_02710 [Clostridia bacterium]|nr:hypothetical protein [Clostridia bacterium]
MKKNEKNQEEKMLELKVTRELLDAKTKSGDDMYGYVLRENIVVNGREREIRVDFAAKDIGGYDMLDIIFMTGDEAFLSVREEHMTDDVTKEVTTYMVYEIWNEDEDGIPYVYKVKPMRESDKAKLNVILQKRALAYEKFQAAEAALTPEAPEQTGKKQ